MWYADNHLARMEAIDVISKEWRGRNRRKEDYRAISYPGL